MLHVPLSLFEGIPPPPLVFSVDKAPLQGERRLYSYVRLTLKPNSQSRQFEEHVTILISAAAAAAVSV